MERKIGAKLYDPSLCDDMNLDLMQELGFNTIFLGRDALVPSFTASLTKRGMFWNIVEPVFLLDEDDPNQLATLEDGRPAEDSWVRFSCPTDKEHLNQVRERIRRDIRDYNPPGLSLDFLRFFQFWEMTDPKATAESLPKSCFCDRCKDQQKHFNSVEDWRMYVITETARTLCSDIRDAVFGCTIGIHCVPWKQDMFDGAISKVIGQNFKVLSDIGDYLTPMIYHHMMHLQPSYVKEFLDDMYAQGCRHVLPSVQVREAYREEEMPSSEFREALELSLEKPSEGVVLYNWEELVSDRHRRDIVKEVLGELE